MPTYEYRCLDCNKHFEIFQNMSDEPLERCEACNGKLKRLIGAGAGLIFKGNGFYCTDYRSESYNREAGKAEADSKTSGSSKSGADAKSGTKAESASETKAPEKIKESSK